MKMSNETFGLVKSLERTSGVKSLRDLVRMKSSTNAVLLLDVSYSMNAPMLNGKTRITGLREAVTGILKNRPGTTMAAFGLTPQIDPPKGEVEFVTVVPDAQGGTPLAEAIMFAGTNGFGRCVVISDGAPNDRSAAIDAARTFGGQIDVLFVGDAGDPGSDFLDELARLTGGTRFEGDLSDPKELGTAVIGLLNGEVLEQDDNGDDEDEDEDEDDDI